MATFKLTKSHVQNAFASLRETTDLPARNVFFTEHMIPNVTWTITGTGHSLAGTRYNLQDHSNASFNNLGKRLTGAIKFVVTRVVVDAEREEDGWWACVELKGEAMRKTGEKYNNEYIWLTRWDDEGKIVEVRSYFDTLFAEKVLQEPE
ncbi:Fc.00g095800.m01.CDS01 [Cosmosporella sp. VM-42]